LLFVIFHLLRLGIGGVRLRVAIGWCCLAIEVQGFRARSERRGVASGAACTSLVASALRRVLYRCALRGIGRAIGETMAVILVAGNQPRIPTELNQGVRTLTTNIVMEMAYATGQHREALIATAVVLFVFILIINLFFTRVKNKGGKR